MAVIHVVIGFGVVGGRVIELLHTYRTQSPMQERVLFSLPTVDEQSAETLRFQKLLKTPEQVLGQDNQAIFLVVVEAGAQESGYVSDVIGSVREALGARYLLSAHAYWVMPTEAESEKSARAYAYFSEMYQPQSTEDISRVFDHWVIVENRVGVEQSLAAAIETNPLDDTLTSDLQPQHVSSVHAVTLRLPVTDMAALWKVEDLLTGMDVLGVRQPESVLKQMADAVVFNPFNGDVTAWKRSLTNERLFSEELVRLTDSDRLEKLLTLPVTKSDLWRKQDDLLRPLSGDKPASQDALTSIETLIRGCYEPEPMNSLDETVSAITAMGASGGKVYTDMLRQMYDGAVNAVLRQFEQLTSNAILMPEEYAQVAERAASALVRLSAVLNDVASQLSQRYSEARATAMEKLKTALRPPTFNRMMMKMLQGVSPEKEASEAAIGLISLTRGRHIVLVASAALDTAAVDLTRLAGRARQVDDAVVLWREALGRYRRTLIERLGALMDGAGRVETWGITRKTAQIGDYPKPVWAWGLGILRCHNQNLSLTDPNVEGLLKVMPAYDDAASRLSLLDYLSETSRPEHIVPWLIRRTLPLSDVITGMDRVLRATLYPYTMDNAFASGVMIGLKTELGEGHDLKIIAHSHPSIMAFKVEIGGLSPMDDLKSVKRAQQSVNHPD